MNTHLTLHEFRLGFVRVEYNMDFLGTRLEEEISERERAVCIEEGERDLEENEKWELGHNQNGMEIYIFLKAPLTPIGIGIKQAKPEG